jgi:PPOX class probable F420-dependent enzyme
MNGLSPRLVARLRRARVGRLGTVDARGRPHVVPICFTADTETIYHAIDRKPKARPPERLARVRNIAMNPHVALLVDHYEENWRRLWFVLVRGRARLVRGGRAHARGLALLRRKYVQYRGHMLAEDGLVIAIRPVSVAIWGPKGSAS